MKHLDDTNALEKMNKAVLALSGSPPDAGAGRGVVICGGGEQYFACAWVCINMLRKLGCVLPIELWHLGQREMSDGMKRLVEPLGVQCVDALEIRKTHPARILNGWELKPYAIIHSGFREVLALDADNVPVIDPTFLFDSPEYVRHGAVFWPDYGRLRRDRKIWELTGVAYRDEPEIESGQILLDKARCWDALALTMWMNEHSDFWYQHIHGDKETFHMAWRKVGLDYAMPSRGIHPLPGTMCQHDFYGRRIFQHRNLRKWNLDENRRVPGFEFEGACLEFISRLIPHRRIFRGAPPFDPILARDLAGTIVDYHRVGYDRRRLSFELDGSIGEGQARMERLWALLPAHDTNVLEIYGDEGTTARLTPRSNPLTWSGKWLLYECMPVEIKVLSKP